MARSDNIDMTPEEELQEELRRENDYIIKNKRVRRQSRRRSAVIILLLFLLIITVLAGVTYAVMSFVEDTNFRVSVSHTGKAWLSLSKDYEFTNPTSVLDVAAPKNMDNSTLCDFDYKLEDVYESGGYYSDASFENRVIATSFYLKNSGNEPIYYREIISLDRTVRGMEKAIRVMLIKDEDPTDDHYGTIRVFAATKADGSLEEVVPTGGTMTGYLPKTISSYDKFSFEEGDIREDGIWMTEAFLGDGYVLNSDLYPLGEGGVVKYTVVVWLEGQDEQCVDDILGGQVKLTVEFETGTLEGE